MRCSEDQKDPKENLHRLMNQFILEGWDWFSKKLHLDRILSLRSKKIVCLVVGSD
jgi:hypothetical protein